MKARKIISATALIIALAVLTIQAGGVRPGSQQAPGPLPPPSGQQTPHATSRGEKQEIPQVKIAVEAALVNLDILVTDEDGLVLAGLKKENFRVLDDGKVQTISHFELTRAPITVVVLMEYSSGAYEYFAYKSASWGSAFLDRLEPLDYVALVTYDLKPTVRVDFTRNKIEVRDTLTTLFYPQFQEANMYDALIDTLDRLEHVKGKKAILLITTGDNTMSENTLDDTFRRIKKSDVTIFSVGVAEAEYQAAESQLSGGIPIQYLQAKNTLENFAKLSGGSAWFPRFEGEVPDVLKNVTSFLRNQYRIGFSPANLAHDGKYHKLKVQIVQPDGNSLMVTNPKGKRRKTIVYAREGYTAPGRSSRN